MPACSPMLVQKDGLDCHLAQPTILCATLCSYFRCPNASIEAILNTDKISLIDGLNQHAYAAARIAQSCIMHNQVIGSVTAHDLPSQPTQLNFENPCTKLHKSHGQISHLIMSHGYCSLGAQTAQNLQAVRAHSVCPLPDMLRLRSASC